MSDKDEKNVVCSARPLKIGESRGSMKECADKKQIGYWGFKKADPNIVQTQFDKEVSLADRNKELVLASKYRGRVRRLKQTIEFSKKPDEVAEAKEELIKTERLLLEHEAKFTEIDKKLKAIKEGKKPAPAPKPVASGTESMKVKIDIDAAPVKGKVGRPATKPKVVAEEKKPVGRPQIRPVIPEELKKPRGRPKKE
jgi:hypothetical protein